MGRLVVGCVFGLALVAGLTPGGTAHATRAAASCSVSRKLPRPPADRPSYTLRVRMGGTLAEFSGSLAVSFAPSVATDRIVFRLWPNSPAFAGDARLTVGDVTAGGRRLATSRPNATTLVVSRAVRERENVKLSMTWKLRLSRRPGLALRGGRSARLVSFFPLLAWDGSGWATDAPLRRLGVWPTSPTADFDVRVTLPPRLRVLATGDEIRPGHWRARAVRDFALAIGAFDVVRTIIRAPAPVRVTVGLERGSFAPIQPFVADTRRALVAYARRFGDYPWPTYTLAVMSDFTSFDGFAYPTIGFVGDSSLVLVPHETAHQWFQSLVGNNQSRDPWLSEGLATWAQTGPEKSLATMLATPIPADVRDRLGEPVSFFDRLGFEKLRLGVYVQTVQALATLGDAQTVDCALRQFTVGNAYRTAIPRDLLDAFDDFFADAEARLRARGARF
jgi:hypothetical protein